MTTLDADRLSEYLLGQLDPAEQRGLERELAASPEARAQLQTLQDTFDALALSVEPVAPSTGLKGRILSSLEPETRFEGFVERLAVLFDLGTARVRELIAAVDEAPGGRWERTATPGACLLHFEGGPRVVQAHCGLVYIEAGRELPPHRHDGDERMLVIQGYARENDIRFLAPGDFVDSGPGSAHSVRVLNDAPMVFAVVLHGTVHRQRD